MKFADLAIKGMTFKEVYLNDKSFDNDAIIFVLDESNGYALTHLQDCCEGVYIESIDGDLSDLVGEPLVMAEEAYQEGESDWGTSTWSFYKFATTKGYVTVRFFGESNGYYSEEARVYKIKDGSLHWLE